MGQQEIQNLLQVGPFWNHTQGQGLKPNLSALDLFCCIIPTLITSFQFMANHVSHQNLLCSYVPNLTKSLVLHTQHWVCVGCSPLCRREGDKAELPPKVTCAALKEMNYKPLLEETPVLLFPSKFLNAASSNPGIQTLTQLCSLYFISKKSLTCPPPLGPSHRNNIPPKSKRQEKHPQTIPLPPLHFRPDV